MYLQLPDTRQQDENDCGPGVVRCVCAYWADKLKHNALVQELLTTEDGTDPLAMEAWLRLRGYYVLSGSMTLDDLKMQMRMERPVICPVTMEGYGHYVVSAGIYRGRIQYHDPWYGLKSMRAVDFDKVWRGDSRYVRYERWGLSVWA